MPFLFLWTELGKFLVHLLITLKEHQQYRTIYTIPNTIYVNEGGKEVAMVLSKRGLNQKVSREGITITTSQSFDTSNENSYVDEKIAL